MKKLLLSAAVVCVTLLGACQKNKTAGAAATAACADNPRTGISTAVRGNWMYGHFSMTEYWSQNPADYLGNAFQFAIAFKFNADGSYEQYFTSSTVSGGITTYQQSVTRGTVVLDETTQTIKTYACSAHYKRTRNNQTVEERDLAKTEITTLTTYTYTTGTENNGTKFISLLLQNTTGPLKFYQQP